MVTSFTFLFTGLGASNLHTALGNKLKEMEAQKLDGWEFNEKQLAFIKAVLKEDLRQQFSGRRNISKKLPENTLE